MAKRLPRFLRLGLWSLAGVLALTVAAGAIFALTFDPDSYKPRIVAAVKQATGRDLAVNGHIRLGISLHPTLVVHDVSLANPPGFSRPQMATLGELDVKLALLPLLSHRVEITRMVLVKPDIILETDAHGRPNWQFTPEAKPAAATHSSISGERHEAAGISASDVRVENGTVTWRDGQTGRSAVLGLTSLRVTAASPEANLHLAMAASYANTPFKLTAEVGSLTRLQASSTSAAWPVQARLEAAGATLALDGSVAQPLEGRGYAMKLAANVPDLAALAPLLPGVALPALREVTLAAQVADGSGPMPDISGLTLHVGASDLAAVTPGLKLAKLEVSAPRLDQPVQVALQASLGATPIAVSGTAGAPAMLLPGAKSPRPVPLDVTIQAAGSQLAVKGSATRGPDGRPSLQAEVSSSRFDADALKAAIPPRTPGAASQAPPGPAPTPPVRAAGNNWMIPDTPVPFALLRLADADVKLRLDELVAAGATYRAVAAHLVLQNGRMRLDPLTVDTPDGHIEAAVTADAGQPAPPVSLRLNAPALVMQRLLAALGQQPFMSGNVRVQADLRGAGATPHAIAASLEGSLALTMLNGTMDNRLLGSTLGSLLREINLLDLVGRGGSSEVRCMMARADASHGVLAVRSLVFASSLLTMDGGGSINLANETVDLRLRPQARVGVSPVVIPMRVSGSWRAPAAQPDAAGAVVGNAGTVATVLGSASPLGVVAGALAGQKLLGGSADCGGDESTAQAPATPRPKAPDIGNALKQLFR